jgi:hypothetical protein
MGYETFIELMVCVAMLVLVIGTAMLMLVLLLSHQEPIDLQTQARESPGIPPGIASLFVP